MNKFKTISKQTCVVIMVASASTALEPQIANANDTSSEYEVQSLEGYNDTSFENMIVTPSVSYTKTTSENMHIDKPLLERKKRYDRLRSSFNKNLHGFQVKKNHVAEEVFNALSALPFTNNVSNYDEFDDSINVIMNLPYELKLSVARFMDEEDSTVVFSIHQGARLLVSNEMPIELVVKDLNGLINQIGK
jgi:hypothetical protein